MSCLLWHMMYCSTGASLLLMGNRRTGHDTRVSVLGWILIVRHATLFHSPFYSCMMHYAALISFMHHMLQLLLHALLVVRLD